jgi:hypothetical protein
MMLNFLRAHMRTQKVISLFRFLTWVVAGVQCTPILFAQFLTEALPDKDVGRPPQPPFITLLSIVTPGQLVTDSTLPPAGPVVQTVYEELRARATPAGPAGEVMTSIAATWEAGHVVEEIRKDGILESDTINSYAGGRLVSQETTMPAFLDLSRVLASESEEIEFGERLADAGIRGWPLGGEEFLASLERQGGSGDRQLCPPQ